MPAKLLELDIDLRRSTEEQVRGFTEPSSDKLLPDLHPMEQHVFTLVLDLNETLIYSDWKRDRGWRTFKRPGIDAFLEHLAQFYEIVVYSDQPSMYVDPSVDRLDPKHFIRYRLSRAATKYRDQKHYRLIVWAPTRERTIERMKRALGDTIITGVPTTIEYHKLILEVEDFKNGKVDTAFIPKHEHELAALQPQKIVPTTPAKELANTAA